MTRLVTLFAVVIGLCTLAAYGKDKDRVWQRGKPGEAAQIATYGNLALSFEKNQGQSDSQVQFLAHGQRYTLFLNERGAVLVFRKQQRFN
jgi:hypothetical protein